MNNSDPLGELIVALVELTIVIPILAAYIIVMAVVRAGSWLARRGGRTTEQAERDRELRRVLREAEAASRRISRIAAAGEREIRGHVRRVDRRNSRW
jgi:uncharacterized membrane protein